MQIQNYELFLNSLCFLLLLRKNVIESSCVHESTVVSQLARHHRDRHRHCRQRRRRLRRRCPCHSAPPPPPDCVLRNTTAGVPFVAIVGMAVVVVVILFSDRDC